MNNRYMNMKSQSLGMVHAFNSIAEQVDTKSNIDGS